MEPSLRHRLYEAARLRAGLTVEQLWLSYLALSGEASAGDLERYLHGLGPLSRSQQDVLAHALNERLGDLRVPDRLPYWSAADDPPPREDPTAALRDLFTTGPHRG